MAMQPGEAGAVAALRALGLDAKEAKRISRLRLAPAEIGSQGLLSEVLTEQT
jgi:hypothetical protein